MTRLYNALQQYQKRLDEASAGGAVRHGPFRPGGTMSGGPRIDAAAVDTAPREVPLRGPSVHGPSMHGPTVHGPAVHGPSTHGPSVHGPSKHGPAMPGAAKRAASAPGTVSRLITTTLPRENLLALYGSIQQRLTHDTPRIVQFTSATKGEGTSTVARDFAVTVADAVRKRVLLISVLRPGVDNFAGATPVGLEAVMTGSADQGDVIEGVPGLPLFETTLNAVGAANGHLFDAPAMDRALRSALALVDLVVIDTPPVLNGFVAPALARHCGGTVLVVEAERVRAPKVEEARRTIEAHGGHVIGAVMNKRRWHIPELVYRRLQ
jgi:Mrp family chromosome partitioning ATPase